jgi:HK97 family phage major capsid protein
MSDLNEIKGLVEGINKVLMPLRDEVDALKGKTRDAIDEAKLQAMADKVTSDMATLQEKQRKLEAAISRPGAGASASNEIAAEHRKMFDAYLREGTAPAGIKMSAEGLEIRAMNTNVQPDGGYLVRPELAQFVVDRIFETSPLRQVARVERIGSKSLDVLIDDDQAAARWVNEGPSGGQTAAPKLGQKEITAHKIEADPRVTTEQLQDSYLDVEAWLGEKVADRFARLQNTAFVTGNGVGQPRGFLDYLGWANPGVYQRDRLERRNLGVALGAPALISLQYDLKEAYQAGAVWGMKRTTYASVLRLAGADQFYFGPVLMRDGQAQLTLLGKPVIFMDDMPTVADGNLCVVYGDFGRGYTIADRVGLQVLRDPFTNKGFVTYYTTQRVGGDVTNFEALKIGVSAAIL